MKTVNSPVIEKYLLMKIFGPNDGQLICIPKANIDETLAIFLNLLPELSVINFHSDLPGHLLFCRVVPSVPIFHNWVSRRNLTDDFNSFLMSWVFHKYSNLIFVEFFEYCVIFIYIFFNICTKRRHRKGKTQLLKNIT